MRLSHNQITAIKINDQHNRSSLCVVLSNHQHQSDQKVKYNRKEIINKMARGRPKKEPAKPKIQEPETESENEEEKENESEMIESNVEIGETEEMDEEESELEPEPSVAPKTAKTAKTSKKVKKVINDSKNGSKGRKPKRVESYCSYIYKVLKQVHPETGISGKAMGIMNDFVNDMFERIASESMKLTSMVKRPTMSSREIQTSVRLLLPGN